MDNDDLDRVVPLDQLDDFKVAEGDPDIRGWEVIASDGQRVGEVDQLLVDTLAMKVRYLDVDVSDDLRGGSAADRHVLIPIGYARLDENDDRVIVDQLASTDVAGLPVYTHGPLTRDFESTLRQRFDTGYQATGTSADDSSEDFYSDEMYDQERLYGGRRMTLSEEEMDVGKERVGAGEVDLRKRVETEHVSRPVTVRHEEVDVERRPITDPMAASGARIEGDEIHIPLTEERAVVEKHVVPKEEIVVTKREVEETQTVEADLRRERLEVDREGSASKANDDRLR